MFKTFDLRKHLVGILALIGCLVWLNSVTHGGGHGYNIKEVDVAGAREMIDQGALIVDVRGQSQFDHRHIAGAILITLEELQAGVPLRLAAIAKDRAILVYCNDGLDHGPRGTELLNKLGYARAVNLKAGIEGWIDSGGAMTPKKTA